MKFLLNYSNICVIYDQRSNNSFVRMWALLSADCPSIGLLVANDARSELDREHETIISPFDPVFLSRHGFYQNRNTPSSQLRVYHIDAINESPRTSAIPTTSGTSLKESYSLGKSLTTSTGTSWNSREDVRVWGPDFSS